jgi:hypothetical protein
MPDQAHLIALTKTYMDCGVSQPCYLLVCSALSCYDTLTMSFRPFSGLLLGIATGVALFAILLSTLFAQLSLRGKSKKAGLLCGLGASRPLLYFYLALEALSVSLVGLFLGLLATAIAIPVFNASFTSSTGIGVSLLGFPFGAAILFVALIFLSLGVLLLAPAAKLTKQSPTLLMKRE